MKVHPGLDKLALTWQAMSEKGADLAYSIYDVVYDGWSAYQMLMSDADVEIAHSPVSGTFTVTNVPTFSISSLAFLEQLIGHDLTFDSFTISPTNPAAEQPVTAKCRGA